jgi:hypothetical protein
MSLKERIEMARQLGRQIGRCPLEETLEGLASLEGDDEEAIMEAFCEAAEQAVDKQEMLDQLKITPSKRQRLKPKVIPSKALAT